MNNVIELLSGVSSDYEKLYESGKYTDISIHVGREPSNKIFFAHFLVLCTRSAYFEDKLTSNTEGQQTAMVFEDMTPGIFEILLRFIYTGKVSSQSCENVSWILLLEGANKLGLSSFCTAIGDQLIKQHEEWIEQNILMVHNYASSTDSLQKLEDYCNQLMLSSPDIILKSNKIMDLRKVTFISLLKNDKLNMSEGDVWMSVVQWAINQISGLSDNPSHWSSNDVNAIKDIMAEFVPYVRFFNISSEELSERVIPYIEVLPRELRSDLLSYHLHKDYKPKMRVLPHRKRQSPDIDSVVINRHQASWILQKIVETTQLDKAEQDGTSSKRQTIPYKLTLLYRESRDGWDNYIKGKKWQQMLRGSNYIGREKAKFFWRTCAEKGPTIAVGRVQDTEEILGGYNPLSWSCKSGYAGLYKNGSTRESFIFSLDKNDVEKSIISFPMRDEHLYKYAIYNDLYKFPAFGLNGEDLQFGGYSDRGNFYGPSSRFKPTYYQIPIRSTSDGFTWVDWEVFSVDI